jgi:hypothetical protein
VRTDYAQIFQDSAAVQRYEQVVYAPDTYSSAVSARQRTYLRDLARRGFPHRRAVQHDFGCGTGRAIRLHCIDADGPLPRPATTDGPALVTVFRLLLNALDEVRDRAVAFAASVLPDPASGLLVIENHGNRGSLRHLGHGRHAGDPWFAELSHLQVRRLLARRGFEIVERRGFALFPPRAYRRSWLRPIARLIDDLAARSPMLAGVCTNVVHMARRMPRRYAPATAVTRFDPTPEVDR